MSQTRLEVAAKALFAFSGGYHTKLTWEQLHPEHKDYLLRSAEAVIEAVDKFDATGTHVSLRDRGVLEVPPPFLSEADQARAYGESVGGPGGDSVSQDDRGL